MDVRRGLCRPCYRNPDIRDDYPPLARGRWKEILHVWGAMNDAVLIEMYEMGLSDKQIATQLSRSVASVTKRRQRLGLRVSKRRESDHKRDTYYSKEGCDGHSEHTAGSGQLDER